MNTLRPLAVLALLVLASPPLHADIVMLGASKDNSIYGESDALSNGIGQFLFAGKNASDATRRALIAFDLSGLPMGSTINSVTLTLMANLPSPGVSGVRTIGLHRLTDDFGEGNSDAATVNLQEGLGAPSQAGDASWRWNFFSSSEWGAPGGNFDATASATQVVNANGFYSWSGAGLIADVQGWVDGPGTNFGWLIASEEVTTDVTLKRFGSRENATAANRPLLTIDFTPGVPEPSGTVFVFSAAFGFALRRRRS
jgi:hypothetical protein